MVDADQHKRRQEEQDGAGNGVNQVRQVPVDKRHLGVQVEAEDEEEDSRHHEGTAADKLEEVDPSTGWALHDSLYADESDEW